MLIKLADIWAWLMKVIPKIIQPRCCNVVLMVTLKVIHISIVYRLVYWLKLKSMSCAFRAYAKIVLDKTTLTTIAFAGNKIYSLFEPMRMSGFYHLSKTSVPI